MEKYISLLYNNWCSHRYSQKVFHFHAQHPLTSPRLSTYAQPAPFSSSAGSHQGDIGFNHFLHSRIVSLHKSKGPTTIPGCRFLQTLKLAISAVNPPSQAFLRLLENSINSVVPCVSPMESYVYLPTYFFYPLKEYAHLYFNLKCSVNNLPDVPSFVKLGTYPACR